MITLSDAIWSLRPGSEFTYKNDDYATIEWHILEGDAPTALEIKAAFKNIEDEEKAAKANKATAKAALLDRLGITAEEAKLLLS
jgi:hypothetical protein